MVTIAQSTPASREQDFKKLPDTSTWLTRAESSDLLNTSAQTLKNHERRGKLHPLCVMRKDARGYERLMTVYDPMELKKLFRNVSRPVALRDPGEIAAQAFELFDEGKTEKEVVKTLRETPDAVRILHDKWLDMGGADLVIIPSAKEALGAIVGPFESVADLVARVTQLKTPGG